MLEFKNIYDTFEKLSVAERERLLTENSERIFDKMQSISAPDLDSKNTLAGFIIGSVTSDCKINEMDYLLIYPSLVRAFGDDFDLRAVKETFQHNKTCKDTVAGYIKKMLTVLKYSDEDLEKSILVLCLCIISANDKISQKKKQYVLRLCEML